MTRYKSALSVLLRTAAAGLLAAAVAAPASAYVVVTVDNQVYEVPTRPEIRDNMVFFVLDGRPVSLRYDFHRRRVEQQLHRDLSHAPAGTYAGHSAR